MDVYKLLNAPNPYAKKSFAEGECFTSTGAKIVFGVTEADLAEIGEPDVLLLNPLYPKAPKTRLYSARRVQQWLERKQQREERNSGVASQASEQGEARSA